MYEKERARQEEINEKQQYEKLQKNILDKMNTLQSAVNQAKREEAKFDRDYNVALVNLY
jgi:hypothetical protein